MRQRRPVVSLLVVLVILAIPALAFAGGEGDFSESEARGLFWVYFKAFGAGFTTSVTPCVYPMIPITTSLVRGVIAAISASTSHASSGVVGAATYVRPATCAASRYDRNA